MEAIANDIHPAATAPKTPANTLPWSAKPNIDSVTQEDAFKDYLIEVSNAELCIALALYLEALGWRGKFIDFYEAQPSQGVCDFTDIVNTLSNLGFETKHAESELDRVATTELPALVLKAGQQPMRLLQANGHASLLDNREQSHDLSRHRRQKYQIISAFERDSDPPGLREQANWFSNRLQEQKNLFLLAFMLTGVSNALALAVPLFVMTVYDRVIRSGETGHLAMLGAGVVLALGFDFIFKNLRARVFSFAGARFSFTVANGVIDRLLRIPLAITERASLSSQLSRVRDIEQLRSMLTGPLMNACMELPFAILLCGVLFVLAGPIALIPLAGIFAYLGGGAILMRVVARLVSKNAKIHNAKQEFLLEVIGNIRALRVCGSRAVWRERSQELINRSAIANFATSLFTAVASSISQALTLCIGLATMACGVYAVMAGNLTAGGLIASMILVWRIIAPLQTAFVAVSRIHQVRASSNQLSRFMTHEIERSNKDAVNRAPKLTGDLVFDRVSFRYGQDEPAIVGASFHASPGEVIAILGRNGSGKSTILKLILGLYQPQMGSVLLDGHNIRQFDPADIRRQIAYVPQNPQFFEGTIAHNLRLVKPQASQNQIDLALSRAGVLDAVNQLPLGLESVITQRQPQMISQSTLARLSLARAYLKDSPIVLLDEPINGLDFEAEYAFVEAISNLKGKATVFVVTHRPSHMHASDKVLLLDHGNIAYFGETEKVKDKIPREAM